MKTIKIIDLLNMIAYGKIPKKIKVDNKYIYIHDGIDYKNNNGTYLFNSYIETTTEDMNIEVEILEEEKKIPEKLHYCDTSTENEDIKFLIKNNNYLVDKWNELIDYLESKGE